MRAVNFFTATTILISTGCASFNPYAVNSAATTSSVTPYTNAEWKELAKQAQKRLPAKYRMQGKPVRLKKSGYLVEHTIRAKRNHCYAVALAWKSFPQAVVNITYGRSKSGKPVNINLGGTSGRLNLPSGAVRFCADNSGTTKLSVSALTSSGYVATNQLLQFALVIGAKRENKSETLARQKDEERRGKQAKATMKQNVDAAKKRKQKNQEFQLKEARRKCSKCNAEFYHCLQITSNSVRCENKFYKCAKDKLWFEVQKGVVPRRKPCGDPPR